MGARAAFGAAEGGAAVGEEDGVEPPRAGLRAACAARTGLEGACEGVGCGRGGGGRGGRGGEDAVDPVVLGFDGDGGEGGAEEVGVEAGAVAPFGGGRVGEDDAGGVRGGGDVLGLGLGLGQRGRGGDGGGRGREGAGPEGPGTEEELGAEVVVVVQDWGGVRRAEGAMRGRIRTLAGVVEKELSRSREREKAG